MSATIVLRKKIVRLPKRKQCDRCPFYDINLATRKDDHGQDCCEECWEGLPEMYCSSCHHEYRGDDQNDCCPRCLHHPDDPECPCGCKEDDEEEKEGEDEEGAEED
jgi:hypothetical protein